MIRSVMFYLNQNKPSVCEAVQTGVKLCRQKGIEPVFFESDRRFLSEELGAEFEQAAYLPEPDFAQIDMMFVFGGDGTMLRALDLYVDRDIPMLGINLGRLGFLLETQVHELSEALDSLLKGEYAIEHRMMLQVEGVCEGKAIQCICDQ